MKFLIALSFLLGVALALVNVPLPTVWDCDAIPAPYVRPENVSATDLYTPEFATAPTWSAATMAVPADHILLHIAYPRYLLIQNISAGDPILMYENNGACHNDSAKRWSFEIAADNDYYFIRARISFAALGAIDCQFEGVNQIYCVWWMTAIEPYVLGGVVGHQVQTVRWQVHIALPNRLREAYHNLRVWPKAEYASAILVFEEYPPPDYSVRVVFLIMVAKPYMAEGAYLVPPEGMTGWANPPLVNDLTDLSFQTTVCVDYGTQFCYQQIVVDLVPTDPCGTQPWPLSRNTFNGTYELGGTTKCEQAFPDCNLPAHQGWYDWSFVFEFDTNDFCPTYLTYNLEGKLQGMIRTYNTSAMDMIETMFVAGATVWGKIWIERLNGFPWIIKSVETSALSIGVSTDATLPFTYYSLVPFDSRLDQNLVQFSGVQQMNYSVTQPNIAYNYFSIVMSAFEDSFLLGITPSTLRHYIFNATLIAWYQWDMSAQGVELQADSMQRTNAMYVSLGVPTALNGPIPVIPTVPTANAAAASGSTGLIAGVAVGCVALLAIVAVAAVFAVRRRRSHYTTQSDTA